MVIEDCAAYASSDVDAGVAESPVSDIAGSLPIAFSNPAQAEFTELR